MVAQATFLKPCVSTSSSFPIRFDAAPHGNARNETFWEQAFRRAPIYTVLICIDPFGSVEARYFETLGINVYDAWSFFKLLDEDGGGSVEPEVSRLHFLKA